MTVYYIYAAITLAAAWIAYDAARVRRLRNLPRGPANHWPLEWMVFALLLWMVAIPLYVSERAQAMEAPALSDAERAAELVKPRGAWRGVWSATLATLAVAAMIVLVLAVVLGAFVVTDPSR